MTSERNVVPDVHLKIYGAYERSTFIYDDYIQRADYEEGARRLTSLIRKQRAEARTLLDVGCGSGKYLNHLQHNFSCQGLEISEGFLEIARKRCPALPIHKGNMIDFDLGRQFDAICCLFLAIAYVRTVENMERAIASMARHLNPGGVLFIEPWVYPEKFWVGKVTSESVRTGDRDISRMFVTKREGNVSVYDIHYLVGTPQGIDYFVEREELGLFTDAEYKAAFSKAGLSVSYDRDAGLFDAHNIGMYWGKAEGESI